MRRKQSRPGRYRRKLKRQYDKLLDISLGLAREKGNLRKDLLQLQEKIAVLQRSLEQEKRWKSMFAINVNRDLRYQSKGDILAIQLSFVAQSFIDRALECTRGDMYEISSICREAGYHVEKATRDLITKELGVLHGH